MTEFDKKSTIEILAETEHLTLSDLAKLVELNGPQSLYDIKSGKTKKVSPKIADKILAKFPHYSRKWLLTHEGNMLKQKPKQEENETDIVRRFLTQLEEKDNIIKLLKEQIIKKDNEIGELHLIIEQMNKTEKEKRKANAG